MKNMRFIMQYILVCVVFCFGGVISVGGVEWKQYNVTIISEPCITDKDRSFDEWSEQSMKRKYPALFLIKKNGKILEVLLNPKYFTNCKIAGKITINIQNIKSTDIELMWIGHALLYSNNTCDLFLLFNVLDRVLKAKESYNQMSISFSEEKIYESSFPVVEGIFDETSKDTHLGWLKSSFENFFKTFKTTLVYTSYVSGTGIAIQAHCKRVCHDDSAKEAKEEYINSTINNQNGNKNFKAEELLKMNEKQLTDYIIKHFDYQADLWNALCSEYRALLDKINEKDVSDVFFIRLRSGEIRPIKLGGLSDEQCSCFFGSKSSEHLSKYGGLLNVLRRN